MGKTARTLTVIMLGLNAIYCALIYKCGECTGEEKALDWVREKVEEVTKPFMKD